MRKDILRKKKGIKLKKLIVIGSILVSMLLAGASYAGDWTVGSTFGDGKAKLTTLNYTLSEYSEGWQRELSVGYATGVKQFKQPTGIERYTLDVGLGIVNKAIAITGGYTIGYINAEDNDVFPGWYGKGKLNLGKSLALEVKYTDFIDTDNPAEGWQGGLVISF